MVLHGIREFELEHGDTLTEPLHLTPDGRLRTFTKVLSDPPFSLNYDADLVAKADELYGTRMKWGWAPEGGKKADLMFVQHMVSVLEQRGTAAIVMPHGVLFRGGQGTGHPGRAAEGRLHRGGDRPRPEPLLRHRHPGVRSGLCDPRAASAGSARRRSCSSTRTATSQRDETRTSSDPQHVEKIVTVFQAWRQLPGYSRAVEVKDLLAAEANLNIRRWVDNSPPAEPQDVRAHLYGGVPVSEVASKEQLFTAYRVDATALFAQRDDDPEYYDFLDEGPEATAQRIPVWRRTARRSCGRRTAPGGRSTPRASPSSRRTGS
ncbi:site-specific DNA-methyltransferase (adenine-specific) OS=Streptomyces microflavus OX=1919 GN=Smic_59130 PE=4 SV=1 [Streptomyces microflavus]